MTNLPFINMNIIMSHGGIGDNIWRLQAAKSLLRDHENFLLHIYAPGSTQVIGKRFLKEFSNRVTFHFEQDIKDMLQQARVAHSVNFSMKGPSYLSIHLADHSYMWILDRLPFESEYVLPFVDFSDEFNPIQTDKPYVCLTTNFTSETRKLLPALAEGIVKHCLERGQEVVLLGNSAMRKSTTRASVINYDSKTSVVPDGVIDMRDRTTVLQLGSIIQGAKAMIGVDDGLLHLACLTGTPRVAGFTSVDPETRVSHNEGWFVVDQKSSCTYCQTKMKMQIEHDFRFCYYNTYECLEGLGLSSWKKSIDEALG